MEYPEEIYNNRAGHLMTKKQIRLSGWARERAYELGHDAGYAKCLAEQSDPLAGYSNLTAAISAGEPIDWERLDGKRVQCVKPEVTTFKGKLERNKIRPANKPTGWWHKGADSLYRSAFIYGWTGHDGWTLWIEGEIPIRRKTADQLPVTTFFKGCRVGTNGAGSFMCVGESKHGKFILSAIDFLPSSVSAEKWEVIEEYGTFQKPEGK